MAHHRFNTSYNYSMEYHPETISEWIHELKDVSHNELKIKISQKTTDGEQFVPILHKIHNILNQLTIRLWCKDSHREIAGDITQEDELQVALRFLGSETIIGLIRHMNMIKEHTEEMSKLLLDIICYLVNLDPGFPISFATVIASCLVYIDSHLWPLSVEMIISLLCYYALPMVILYNSCAILDPLSISSTLMIVFDNQNCQPKHHLLLMNMLMKLKLNACTDLLSVVAYGTDTARKNALKLLLHFWPLSFTDYTLNDTFAKLDVPFPECEATSCPNTASYLCLEGSCTTQFGKLHSKDGNKKLYSLMCAECDRVFHRNISDNHKRFKIGQPIHDVKPNCELRKVCAESESIKRAAVTCYGESCTAIQNGYPIRLCHECHMEEHTHINDPLHIYQVGPQNPWSSDDMISTSVLLDAIAKLLRQPPIKDGQRRVSSFIVSPYSISVKNSREGLLLLHQYCMPSGPVKQGRHKEWMEHLTALVLEWLRLFNELIQKTIVDEGHEANDCLLLVSLRNSESFYSNYRELSGLIVNHVIPWLTSIYDSGNIDCLLTALLPHLSGHVQVGQMWEYAREPIERYERTLSILVLLVKNMFLSQDAIDKIYNAVMPQWMDLLVELRSAPGQMHKLKHLFHVLFPSRLVHDLRIKRFEFIREKFFQKSSKAKQTALYWLQDLSRLSVVVPYTSHIFEGGFKDKTIKSTTTQAGGPEDDIHPMPLLRKESTGSLSGYESESGLVSQMSTNPSTQTIIQLNFSLPRYILMLDIWYSQLNLCEGSLNYETFQKFLVYMLSSDWGTTHSMIDHRDYSNNCLLCQAVSMWFNLSLRIIQHYLQKEEKEDAVDVGASPVPKRGRVSIKFAIQNLQAPLKKRLTNNELVPPSLEEISQLDGPTANTERKKSSNVQLKTSGDNLALDEDKMLKLPQYQHHRTRDRRHPILMEHAELDLSVSTPPNPTPSFVFPEHLYNIFQLCIEKLNASYHPDTVLQIITFISCLIAKCSVLTSSDNVTVLLKDGRKLLEKLWKLMEIEVSFINQACVNLLLLCQDELIAHECPMNSSIQSSYLWKLLQDGFTSQGWKTPFKTVDKLTMILQFMPGIGEDLPLVMKRQRTHTELILAYGFCKMINFIQDKDSKVSMRVYYCMTNMKKESLEMVHHFLLTLFIQCPAHRDLVLQTLFLTNSSLPQLSFLNIPFILNFLSAIELLRSRDPDDVYNHLSQPSIFVTTPVRKKTSDASILSGHARMKEGRPSTCSSAYSFNLEDDEPFKMEAMQLYCDTMTLLLEFIAGKNSSFEEMDTSRITNRKPNRSLEAETTAESLISKFDSVICKKFQLHPNILSQTRLYETFLIKIYKILDYNIKFSQDKGFLKLVLHLLAYSVSTNPNDFSLDVKRSCSCTLGNIPNHLQPHWLRALFVVIYKYSHIIMGDITQEQSNPLMNCIEYCIQLVVNTLSCSPHVCQLSQSQQTSSSAIIKPMVDLPISPNMDTLISESPIKPRFERRPLDTVPEEESSILDSSKNTPTQTKPHMRHNPSVTSISSTYTSTTSIDREGFTCLLQSAFTNNGTCRQCQQPYNVFTEEVISLGVLCLGTCSHRMPSAVSPHLVTWIIPSIARVVIPGHYYWQNSMSLSDPVPGSGMSIAKKFLTTIISQFIDRRMFVYFFRHDYNDMTDTVLRAVIECLSVKPLSVGDDGEHDSDILTVASPVEYFLEDVSNSTSFDIEVIPQSLKNLALYLELLIPETSSASFRNLNHLEFFLKKLKEQPNVLTESFYYFLRIIIQLLKFSDPSATSPSATLSAITQDFPDILSTSLYKVYCPAGGLVILIGTWNRAFIQCGLSKRRDLSKKHILLKHLIEHFSNSLTQQQTDLILPENLISICQSFLLLLKEYKYFGYIDTLWEDRVYTPQLVSDFDVKFEDALENAFHNALRLALTFLACQLPKASLEVGCQMKLIVAQLIVLRVHRQRFPIDLVQRIFEGQYSFSWDLDKGPKSHTTKGTNLESKDLSTDHTNILLLIGWLLLGSLCHNAVHGAVIKAGIDRMDSVLTNECEILLRISPSTDKAVNNVLDIVIKALHHLVEKVEMAYWNLNLIFCFCTIWTVYFELHGGDTALPEITNFWRLVVDKVLQLPSTPNMLMCTPDIVETFCQQTLVPLKQACSGISCFDLLLPTWKRVINMLQSPQDADLPQYSEIQDISMDEWYRNMLAKFSKLESELQHHS